VCCHERAVCAARRESNGVVPRDPRAGSQSRKKGRQRSGFWGSPSALRRLHRCNPPNCTVLPPYLHRPGYEIAIHWHRCNPKPRPTVFDTRANEPHIPSGTCSCALAAEIRVDCVAISGLFIANDPSTRSEPSRWPSNKESVSALRFKGPVGSAANHRVDRIGVDDPDSPRHCQPLTILATTDGRNILDPEDQKPLTQRHYWILTQLSLGRKLIRRDVMTQFGYSERHAKRILRALNPAGADSIPMLAAVELLRVLRGRADGSAKRLKVTDGAASPRVCYVPDGKMTMNHRLVHRHACSGSSTTVVVTTARSSTIAQPCRTIFFIDRSSYSRWGGTFP